MTSIPTGSVTELLFVTEVCTLFDPGFLGVVRGGGLRSVVVNGSCLFPVPLALPLTVQTSLL